MKMTMLKRSGARCFRRLLQMVMLMSVLLAAPAAHAGTINCFANTPVGYAPDVGINPFPRDAPVGSVTQSYSTTVGFHCERDPCCDRDIFINFAVNPSSTVPGETDIYPTNIGGVGVRYTISNGTGPSCNSMPKTITGSVTVTCHQLPGPSSPGIDFKLTLSAQFVKRGPFESGRLSTIPGVSATLTANNQPGTTTLGTYIPGQTSGSFVSTACSVTQPSIRLPMPNALVKDLGSVGATTGAAPFAVALNCDPGVRVAMTWSDATTPSNRSCTLSLSPDSTARGIGYQIVYADRTVCYGPDSVAPFTTNQFFVTDTPTSGGLLSVPFQVRYVRTGDMNSGSANALATFTMSYQ